MEGVNRSSLVVGLMGVFAGMTVVMVLLALTLGSPVVFIFATPFAAATYLFYQQASGKMRERIEQQARQARMANEQRRRQGGGTQPGEQGRTRGETGGFGAGPRFGDANTRFGRQSGAGGRTRQGQRIDSSTPSGPSRTEAADILGVAPDADEQAIKRAYREAVKEKHPDRGGDEEEFKDVTEAYDRLTE
ncbi:DnaJ domain-containing protein [Halosegnis rubeus]|jgi:DnaJ-domain-containing protein 1|uniref:DnaJ domain-containing protein n=1 Tax=Halosegnis rubeus TaxID=2212850 RepID=A0A5N5UPQ8_9EURY|nr:J domain-containing protein [Halosegnis rubeus]KAB7515707.1 DnaJ domain-containing protein [Halosegnis rubeus]KAB7517078.1 DnaJ domain-containing protein [Halosegnis rubeus]KAB7519794.1 DnaJ domain-containing protein [Halosegnis rubeus]